MIKARLYRGPANGKVYHIRDDESYLMYSELPRQAMYISDLVDPQSLITTKTHIYRRTKHTHPDGSVFFEWDKPRKKR